MANSDLPQGARPYGQVRPYSVYQSGSAVYPGDFVTLDANGQAVPVNTGSASHTGSSCGVAMSYASASGQDVLVCDDPAQKFIVQADGSEVDAQTDINLNYAIQTAAPNAAYKRSSMELDSSTGATTATLPLKLVSIYREVNNALGAQVECIVKINNHELGESTGTAGI